MVQHRGLVQLGPDLLQILAPARLLKEGEHDAVGAPVARPEGDQHPHAGPEAVLQLPGDQVVIWLVNGVDRLGYRDFRHFAPQVLFPPRVL